MACLVFVTNATFHAQTVACLWSHVVHHRHSTGGHRPSSQVHSRGEMRQLDVQILVKVQMLW